MTMDLKTFITGMPKAELHMHLEGALEPSLVRALAERNHLPVPPSAKERTSGWDFHDLTSFLAIYYPNMAVLQTEEDFCDLAWSYLSKAHSQNVVHTEMVIPARAFPSRSSSTKGSVVLRPASSHEPRCAISDGHQGLSPGHREGTA